jgi:hypothetical protein
MFIMLVIIGPAVPIVKRKLKSGLGPWVPLLCSSVRGVQRNNPRLHRGLGVSLHEGVHFSLKRVSAYNECNETAQTPAAAGVDVVISLHALQGAPTQQEFNRRCSWHEVGLPTAASNWDMV